MAELRESSLLFSLDSLLAHERERVADERRQAEAQRALEAERHAAEVTRRAEDEARRAAEVRAAALRAEELRREEQARLEGIRRAEVERVTAEARLRSEIELAARKSEHELRLTALHATERARATKGLLGAACLVALLSVAGALSLEFGIRRPELRRLQASFDSELSSERSRTGRVQVLLEESERRARQLESALEKATPASAPSPAVTTDRAPPARPARPPVRPGPHERRPCGGNPDDPLNPCL